MKRFFSNIAYWRGDFSGKGAECVAMLVVAGALLGACTEAEMRGEGVEEAIYPSEGPGGRTIPYIAAPAPAPAPVEVVLDIPAGAPEPVAVEEEVVAEEVAVVAEEIAVSAETDVAVEEESVISAEVAVAVEEEVVPEEVAVIAEEIAVSAETDVAVEEESVVSAEVAVAVEEEVVPEEVAVVAEEIAVSEETDVAVEEESVVFAEVAVAVEEDVVSEEVVVIAEESVIPGETDIAIEEEAATSAEVTVVVEEEALLPKDMPFAVIEGDAAPEEKMAVVIEETAVSEETDIAINEKAAPSAEVAIVVEEEALLPKNMPFSVVEGDAATEEEMAIVVKEAAVLEETPFALVSSVTEKQAASGEILVDDAEKTDYASAEMFVAVEEQEIAMTSPGDLTEMALFAAPTAEEIVAPVPALTSRDAPGSGFGIALALGGGIGDEKSTYPSEGEFGRYDPAPDPDNPPQGIFGGKKGISLFGDSQQSGADDDEVIGVNSFLWRATLDTLSFMPLASADPFGGVIITDWHSNPESPGERFKVVVYILDSSLRVGALRVSVFRQEKSADDVWKDAVTEENVHIQLENAILTRARELRLARIEEQGG